MWIVKAALKNPYAVIVFALLILVVGIFYAVWNIPVDILPVFKAPAVQVLTFFQGMPAPSIEKTITNRIERWTCQAPGAYLVESKSVPGVSVVKLYFRDDIDPNAALTMTTSLAQGSVAYLPPNTLPPVVLPFDPTGSIPLGILTISNPGLGEARIKDLARVEVKSMLGAVPGCVAPVVVGGKDRMILVYLDPNKLRARNLSPVDVVRALQKGNLMVTPGTAYFGQDQVLLDTNAMVDKIEELNDLPIRIGPDQSIYLKDIGHVEDSSTIQTSRVRINGRREVYVPIYRQQGASSLAVADGVKHDLERMMQRLPPGTKLQFVMDQSLYVREAINSLVHEGLLGAVLVGVMILVFLGNWRMTLIAVMSIPLAILCAITGLYVTGNTINAMTLGGLALAIGPLVDDAIVVLENTHRHHSLGKSKIKAAFDGAVEVTIPVLVATATTIIVLCPIAMTAGIGGFLFRPLTLAVAFAMISSFVLSRTFVPMFCAQWLGEHIHPGEEHTSHGWGTRVHHRIERLLTFLTHRYERLLAWALRRRGLVLGAVAALFVGSLFLTLGIGWEFFPQADAGQITLYVRAPSTTRLDAAEDRIAELEKFIQEQIPGRERELMVTELGLAPDWSAAYTANSGQQDAVIRLQLNEHRTHSAQEYAILLRHAIEADGHFRDLRVGFDTGGMISAALNYGASSPIDVQIEGGRPSQAMDLANDIRNRIAYHPAPPGGAPSGVRGAADVRVLQRLDAPYLVLNVDRKKAGSLGLTTEDVIFQVVAAMNSSVSLNRNFWIDKASGNQYYVAVQYPFKPDMKQEDLEAVPVTGANQPGVRLSSVVRLERATNAVETNHSGLARTINVLVNTENRDIGSVAAGIDKELKGIRKRLDRQTADLDRQAQELEKLCQGLSQTRKALSKEQLAQLEKILPKEKVPQQTLSAKQQRTQLEAQLAAIVNERDGLRSIRWQVKGEYARMNESFRSLAVGLAGAAVLVYLLMVPLFRSFLGPFIIMFTVPLGLIGVLVMLFVTRTTLNVQSEMGVIFLVGIVVSNGVLLLDFANKQRKLGASVDKAITTAAAIRFRPILMTFLATFLDLVPMAIGMGRGSEANVPLARAVVGGLLTSTFLTLIVVPILYTLLIRDSQKAEVDVDAELRDGLAHEPALAPAFVEYATLAAEGDAEASEDGGKFKESVHLPKIGET